MTRLKRLLDDAVAADPELGKALREEFDALNSRRTFGLVFEPHEPEYSVIPGTPLRKHGNALLDGDDKPWQVSRLSRTAGTATLTRTTRGEEPETVQVDDLRTLTPVMLADETFYPGLVPTGETIGSDPAGPSHAVITAENAHALRMLAFTHPHQFDVVLIDPPYNTRARDWKYNNDYVNPDDQFRHSKWLSFMQTRLELARQVLSDDGVLAVSIDEKEVHNLGVLLNQMFPEARVQMVSTIINPKGSARDKAFYRTDEYWFFVMFGDAAPVALPLGAEWGAGQTMRSGIRWQGMMRGGRNGTRKASPNLFYPVYVRDTPDGPVIDSAGDSYYGTGYLEAAVPDGCAAVWPLSGDGREVSWGLSQEELLRRKDRGYVRLGRWRGGKTAIQHLQPGEQAKVESGEFPILGYRHDGSVIVDETAYVHRFVPGTAWKIASHNAGGSGGSNLVRDMMPDRRFDFPKSLFAVEDILRFFTANKSDAKVLDFFGGSGTTAHAVMRLNAEDGGERTAVLVTNNEVSGDEEKALRAAGHRPGDPEWEALGICDYITKPRLRAAITGRTPAGDPIKGRYRYNREADIADGMEQNLRTFRLTYEHPRAVVRGGRFARVAPLLWLAAGQRGEVIDSIPECGWAVTGTYGVLDRLDAAADFLAAVAERGARHVFIVTDDESAFTRLCADLPSDVAAMRLYADYISTFANN